MMTKEEFVARMAEDFLEWVGKGPKPETAYWCELESFAGRRFYRAYEQETAERNEFDKSWSRDGFGGAD